jgi:putative membrane protein
VAPPPALSLRTSVWPLEVDGAALVLVAVAAVAYGLGVRRLGRKGRAWSSRRTAAFLGGLAVVIVATQLGLARYDTVLFSAHMAQHVLLGMVAPVLLVAGAPLTLALQAGRPGTTRVLRHALHHPLARAVGHPVTAAVLFTATPFVLYLTAIYEATLRNGVLHAWLHIHFVVVGYLWAAIVVGADPHPVRLPHAARLGLVGLTVPGHAFLGIALLSQSTVIAADWYAAVGRTWGATALADQRTGAGLLWAAGEVFGVTVGAIVLARWMHHSEREARRLDRQDDARLAATGVRPA